MAYFIGECSNLTKKKLFAALLYSPINAFFFSVSTWAADEEQNSLVKCTFHLPVHWQIHCFASRFVHCNLQTETGKVRNLFDSDSMFALRTHTATSCKSCACVIHGSFFNCKNRTLSFYAVVHLLIYACISFSVQHLIECRFLLLLSSLSTSSQSLLLLCSTLRIACYIVIFVQMINQGHPECSMFMLISAHLDIDDYNDNMFEFFLLEKKTDCTK